MSCPSSFLKSPRDAPRVCNLTDDPPTFPLPRPRQSLGRPCACEQPAGEEEASLRPRVRPELQALGLPHAHACEV